MNKKVKTTNQPIPAANFGWFFAKNGNPVTVVSKPFTIADLRKGRK